MNVTVLIPTYNERENIQIIIPKIFKCVPEVQILVIDDNSPDGTAEVVEQMMENERRLKLFRREKKEGLGIAYKDAMSWLKTDASVTHMITMDADCSHDPMHLPALLSALETHGLVIGSRYTERGGIENWDQWRFLLSKYGNIYAKFLTGLPVRDLTAGFVGFEKSLLDAMRFDELSASGYAFQIEFKYHAAKYGKAKILEVPIIFRERREGESKISGHVVREGLLTPLKILLKRIYESIV